MEMIHNIIEKMKSGERTKEPFWSDDWSSGFAICHEWLSFLHESC